LSNTPRHPQKKVRRLRGECLIEGLPTGAGIPLDGLRLRLDLRLEPASAAETELSALTEQPAPGRGFTERIVQRALGVPGVYQRWAVLSGLGTLVVTLALWFFGAPQPGLDGTTDAGNPAGSSSSANEKGPEMPAAPSSSAGPTLSSPVAPLPPLDGVGAAPGTGAGTSPALVPALRVAPPASVASRAPGATPKSTTAPDAEHPRPARPALGVAAGIEASALAKSRAAQKPAAPRSVETDLRDLFADTK
jgi:hypothetical protein